VDEFDALLEDPATSIAVVGAGDDPAKWGGRIYRNLKAKGFRVLAVNPGRAVVDGDPCYPSVTNLPEDPTIVHRVPPPSPGRAARPRPGLRVWLSPVPGLTSRVPAPTVSCPVTG
jgi:hypothetical protein